MISSAIAVALFFSQAAADAEPKAANAATSATEMDKVVCRKEAPTGSLIAKKKCRTVRAWSELAEATRRELQSSNSGGSNSN